MSVHPQFAEDLALHALGALEGEERTALERHLVDCRECRRELEQLRGDTALLGLSAAGPAPPQRARQRLMQAISHEPRTGLLPARPVPDEGRAYVPAPHRFAWWAPLGWAAAAAMVAIAIFLWRDNGELRQRLAGMEARAAGQEVQLQQAREIVSTLTAPDALRITLVAAKSPPQPQGKAIYQPRRGGMIFLASNMPSLPAGKVYELWLIPGSGSPIPAGIFKPDGRGSATLINPPLPAGVEAPTFAVTVEPADGPHQAPTSQPIMLGSG